MKLPLARLCLALTLGAATACRQAPQAGQPFEPGPELLHASVQRVTDVMVESITSPPVASRTYAYSGIAAYEALRHDHPAYGSFVGRVNGLDPAPAPDPGKEYLLPLASAYAYLTVAEALVFKPEPVAAFRDSLVARAQQGGAARDVVERSTEYGDRVARHVLAWAGSDNLKRARSESRFEVRPEPGRWQPTPPAYMDGLEPNWHIVRPFVMDSSSQFRPPPPHPYDMSEGSRFHQEVMEVYRVTRELTDEQREIAAFWDCNPYALQAQGHFMFAVKKISPGGHWMGITAIAARQSGADLIRTAEAYARVSIALADAFISVWDEKYRSVVVRPETVINAEIDPAWRPILQTPPFPEYTSGHSVVSTAAAEVLTDLFGEGFAFTDDVEVPYGLPPRSFPSFRAAASEAAMSRLYGGIHYRMAIEAGVDQGRALGRHLLGRLGARSPLFTAAD